MMPDGNNVSGIITAPDGLEPVLRAVAPSVTDGRVWIYRSQFNGAETLRLQSESVDFESTPLGEVQQHLFNGGVAGTLDEVCSFICQLSYSLFQAGIEHSFEIYDDQQQFHRRIPR